MKKISRSTINAILKKTPYAHSSDISKEGLSDEQIKGLFYKAITDDSNSVIAEINRIVEEFDEDISRIDASYSAGKLISLPHVEVASQPFVQIGSVALFYDKIHTYSLSDMANLKVKFDLSTGGDYLFLRFLAPDGVVPDDNLKLTVGNQEQSGLSALSNSAEEAAEGVYYTDFCIKYLQTPLETVKIRWNEGEEKTVVLLFLSSYLEDKDERTFVKFASDNLGTDIGDTWTSSRKYIGFARGKTAPTAYSSYVWAKIVDDKPTTKTVTLTALGWSGNSQTLNVSEVSASSYVFCAPLPDGTSDNIWAYCGVKCVTQGSGTLTFSCRETPSVDVSVNLYIGE